MGKKTKVIVEKFVQWGKDCTTPECFRELFSELELYEKFGRRTPRGERVYDMIREQIREEAATTTGQWVWRETERRWIEEGRRGHLWFREESSRRMAEAYVRGLEEGLSGRQLIEAIQRETGLSIVAVRHWLYELARLTGSEEVVELAREARRMERERYGR